MIKLKTLLVEQEQENKYPADAPEHFGGGENIDIFGYQTKHFDICKSAVTLYEKVDYERELGENYIDITGKYNYKFDNALFIGLDYVNKESKDIYYTIGNIGWQHKSGFKFGLAVKETEPLLNVGFNKKIKKDKLEYLVGLSIKTDLENNNIFNIKSEVKKWLSEKINVFGLYKHEYYNEKQDFQFKVGLGVKLWN